MKYEKGDRVKFVKEDWWGEVEFGELGTFLGYYDSRETAAMVRWDRQVSRRHACGGLCVSGHGWNVAISSIEHVVEDLGEFDSNLVPVSIEALLGG